MTNEEAIKELSVLWERMRRAKESGVLAYKTIMFYDGQYVEALDIAIKALESQPCDDCISRKATIDAIYKKYIGGKDAVENAPINDLYACGLEEAVDAVENMSSVTPS